MRAVVSRVSEAAVLVEGEVIGELPGPGLLVLLAITHDDGPQQAETMARKLHELRILRDGLSIADFTDGAAGLLVVSQFTLYGSTRKGRRPSFTAAARPDHAEPLVGQVVSRLRDRGATVATGRFGATMAVHSIADGPYTVLLDVGGSSRATNPGSGVVDELPT
ncbi:MAG TPA: D-aminoacyl-tRNA deacylase [Pseudonocardiaceae bacterium]|jgi:D-tyrosyl-tRNA(Tyr) deacylase